MCASSSGVRVHPKIIGNVVEETKLVVTGVLEELHLQILYGAVEAAWCYGVVLSIGRGVEWRFIKCGVFVDLTHTENFDPPQYGHAPQGYSANGSILCQ